MSFVVLEPTPPSAPAPSGSGLAARLPSLEGRTVAFVDGWGRHVGDEQHMYPLMRALEERLRSEHRVASVLWYPKESIAKGLSAPRMSELIAQADAAIVGEAI
jgi:hypothetical protein